MKVKTEPSSKGRATLSPIVGVTKEEVANAEKQLLVAEERKKNRSSMINYLNQRNEKSAYDNASIKDRKSFMNEFKAWKTKEDQIKRESKSTRVLTSTKHKETLYDWKNKWELIQQFGKESAECKIESGKLEHKPEQSSGKDTEWIPPPLRNSVLRVPHSIWWKPSTRKST